MSTEKKILTIQRSKWRRGGNAHDEKAGATRLLNDKGMMCCLGFDALACGVPPKAILNLTAPSSVIETGRIGRSTRYAKTRTTKSSLYFYWDDVPAVSRAMKANDEDRITERVRETRVRKELKALGWDDVIFVD